jgi:hypothetical protein
MDKPCKECRLKDNSFCPLICEKFNRWGKYDTRINRARKHKKWTHQKRRGNDGNR